MGAAGWLVEDGWRDDSRWRGRCHGDSGWRWERGGGGIRARGYETGGCVCRAREGVALNFVAEACVVDCAADAIMHDGAVPASVPPAPLMSPGTPGVGVVTPGGAAAAHSDAARARALALRLEMQLKGAEGAGARGVVAAGLTTVVWPGARSRLPAPAGADEPGAADARDGAGAGMLAVTCWGGVEDGH